MTHYDVDYTSLEGDAKRDAALQDIRDYLGDERYQVVCDRLRELPKPMTLDVLSLTLMMTGVQGYPVQALRETIWPEVRE